MTKTDGAGISRRTMFGVGASVVAATALAPGAAKAAATPGRRTRDPEATPLTAEQAWRKLVAGNDRFVAGEQRHPHESLEWRQSLVAGQHPFAVVLGCADSRVSPELVFDEGLGDLFVIRAAGEVLDTSVIGSIEYAVEHHGVKVVSATYELDTGKVTRL